MAQQRNISHEFSPVRKRLEKLTRHIKENENYQNREAQYKQYQEDYSKQLPWKKKSFEEDNRYIVERYSESKHYMDRVKNDKGQIPINAWRKEYSELSARLRELDGEYQALKNEVAQVDKIRVEVYDILREQQKPAKMRSVGRL